jgi:hypothetical protein
MVSVEEDLPVTPGLVLVGDHLVLQIARFLHLHEDGSSSLSIHQQKRRFVFEHLIQAPV